MGDGLLEHVQLVIPGRGIALDELDVPPSSQQSCRGAVSIILSTYGPSSSARLFPLTSSMSPKVTNALPHGVSSVSEGMGRIDDYHDRDNSPRGSKCADMTLAKAVCT